MFRMLRPPHRRPSNLEDYMDFLFASTMEFSCPKAPSEIFQTPVL